YDHHGLPPVPTRRPSDLPARRVEHRNTRPGIAEPQCQPAVGFMFDDLDDDIGSRGLRRYDDVAEEVEADLYIRLCVGAALRGARSEEHTSELQSRENLVC